MLPYLEAMLDNPILEEAANILVRFIEDGARLHMSLIALEKLLEQARQANVALAALWAPGQGATQPHYARPG